MESEFNDYFLIIYQSLQGNNSTASKSVLYELAKVILEVVTSSSLKKIAINILGCFLETKVSLYLSSSLNMLLIASIKHKDEVGKYDDLIKKCVNEDDFYIKRKSLLILKNITNNTNCNENINLIISQLRKLKTIEEKEFVMPIAIYLIENYSNSYEMFLESILNVIESFKESQLDENIKSCYNLITNSLISQFYIAMVSLKYLIEPKNYSNESLMRVIIWIVGESYSILKRVLYRGE